jgi:hypothetical protein
MTLSGLIGRLPLSVQLTIGDNISSDSFSLIKEIIE